MVLAPAVVAMPALSALGFTANGVTVG
jgi:hypothetical protein